MKTNFIRLKGEEKFIIEHEDDKHEKALSEIPAGVYGIKDIGGMFRQIKAFYPIKLGDGLVKFNDGAVAKALNKLNKFFSKEYIDDHKRLDVAHKTGMILYGPPGTGKTSCAHLIMQNLIDKYNAVCIVGTGIDMGFIKSCITMVRNKQKNPIVLFIDEFENNACDGNQEQKLLTFLDGSDSINQFVFIGCTNFIDKVPDRIKNRPSRIKHLIEINRFPDAVYKQYIESKIKGINNERLCELVVLCGEAKLTIDQLKHVIINVEIEKMSVQKAIKSVMILKKDSIDILRDSEDNDFL